MSTYTLLRNRLASFLGLSHNGERDLYQIFGYSRSLLVEDLYAMYRRNDIAYRIVGAYPQATWADVPLIRDEKGSSSAKKDNTGGPNADYSPFAAAAEKLFEDMNLWSYIERADRISRIGRHGILLLGFDGGEELSVPLKGKKTLAYVAPYSELACRVVEWVSEPKDKRYGLPKTYEINPSKDISYGEKSLPSKSFRVDHSRVIHISDSLDQDDVFGVPCLEPIYNRLKDLEKVLGGSAEAFWLNANRGIHFNVDKEFDLDEDRIEKAKKQADEFSNQLRRHIMTQGTEATVLGSDIADVEPTFTALMQVIAGSQGIPMRILLGSEAGELASSQDEGNWSDRIGERRNNFATRQVLRPLIKILIDTGNLPKPKGEWWVEWSETQVSEEKKAAIALQRTQALVSYANSPSAPLIVPEQEFRKMILDMPPVSEYETDLELPDVPEVDPATGEPIAKDPVAEEPKKEEPISNARKPFVNMKPAPLYVARAVLNSKFIHKWAESQGLKPMSPEEMHVTLAYSNTPVDWMKASEDWSSSETGNLIVRPGGPRRIERFGENAVVLSFSNSSLSYRHEALKECLGFDHTYAQYQPHVTLSYEVPPDFDLSKVTMFNEAIVLGPEIFEEIHAPA